jgi:CHASE3 domain sensor protein
MKHRGNVPEKENWSRDEGRMDEGESRPRDSGSRFPDADEARRTVKKAGEKIADTYESAKEDVKEKVSETKETFKDKARGAKEDVKEKVSETKETFKDKANEAKESLQRGKETAKEKSADALSDLGNKATKIFDEIRASQPYLGFKKLQRKKAFWKFLGLCVLVVFASYAAGGLYKTATRKASEAMETIKESTPVQMMGKTTKVLRDAKEQTSDAIHNARERVADTVDSIRDSRIVKGAEDAYEYLRDSHPADKSLEALRIAKDKATDAYEKARDLGDDIRDSDAVQGAGKTFDNLRNKHLGDKSLEKLRMARDDAADAYNKAFDKLKDFGSNIKDSEAVKGLGKRAENIRKEHPHPLDEASNMWTNTKDAIVDTYDSIRDTAAETYEEIVDSDAVQGAKSTFGNLKDKAKKAVDKIPV